MEQAKYGKQSSIPAVEVSTPPADIIDSNVAAPASQTEQTPSPSIGNEAKVDEDGLRVMQDEGGNGESARDDATPATPAALPEPQVADPAHSAK